MQAVLGRTFLRLGVLFLCLMSFDVAAKRAPRGISKIPKAPLPNVFSEAEGKILRWRLKPGDILELKKFSDQSVKTGTETLKRSVYHRVLLETMTAEATKGYLLNGTFQTLLKGIQAKKAYTETEEYTASFYLNPIGKFEVPKDQYMPNIRSVPSFSATQDPALQGDARLDVGMTWDAPGEEVMRFDKLIALPFNVRYEYRGIETVKSEQGEKNCHKFISNYELNYGSQENNGPRVFGYVTAVWFWDAEDSIPYYAQEDYNVIIINTEGLANEFKIKSRSYYRKYTKRNDPGKITLAEKLKSGIAAEDPQVAVRVTDNGVAIALPDVFFETNSATLSSEAKAALDRIGKILRTVENRHIRVRGHTDNVGDEKYNQELSERRAQAVADYLIDETDIASDAMSYDGRGATDPIADNSIAEGRAKNRRVEIILLDK